MAQVNILDEKFYDLDFLPCDLSVYNHVLQIRPLDSAIHWRRPQEFLKIKHQMFEHMLTCELTKGGEQETPTPQGEYETPIHLFYDGIEPADIILGAEHSALGIDYFLSALSILA